MREPLGITETQHKVFLSGFHKSLYMFSLRKTAVWQIIVSQNQDFDFSLKAN